MSICVGAWVQWIFPLLGVDDVNFASPYDKVREWNFLGDIFVLIPDNNGICTQVPIDKAGDEPDGIVMSEALEFITLSSGEKLQF